MAAGNDLQSKSGATGKRKQQNIHEKRNLGAETLWGGSPSRVGAGWADLNIWKLDLSMISYTIMDRAHSTVVNKQRCLEAYSPPIREALCTPSHYLAHVLHSKCNLGTTVWPSDRLY